MQHNVQLSNTIDSYGLQQPLSIIRHDSDLSNRAETNCHCNQNTETVGIDECKYSSISKINQDMDSSNSIETNKIYNQKIIYKDYNDNTDTFYRLVKFVEKFPSNNHFIDLEPTPLMTKI